MPTLYRMLATGAVSAMALVLVIDGARADDSLFGNGATAKRNPWNGRWELRDDQGRIEGEIRKDPWRKGRWELRTKDGGKAIIRKNPWNDSYSIRRER